VAALFFVGYKGGKIYRLAIHSNQANLIVGGLRHRRHQRWLPLHWLLVPPLQASGANPAVNQHALASAFVAYFEVTRANQAKQAIPPLSVRVPAFMLENQLCTRYKYVWNGDRCSASCCLDVKGHGA
jgi:hypothetical protein